MMDRNTTPVVFTPLCLVPCIPALALPTFLKVTLGSVIAMAQPAYRQLLRMVRKQRAISCARDVTVDTRVIICSVITRK